MLQAFEKGHQIEVFFNLKQKFNTRKTLKDPLMSITLLTTEVRNGSPFLISPEPLIVFRVPRVVIAPLKRMWQKASSVVYFHLDFQDHVQQV